MPKTTAKAKMKTNVASKPVAKAKTPGSSKLDKSRGVQPKVNVKVSTKAATKSTSKAPVKSDAKSKPEIKSTAKSQPQEAKLKVVSSSQGSTADKKNVEKDKAKKSQTLPDLKAAKGAAKTALKQAPAQPLKPLLRAVQNITSLKNEAAAEAAEVEAETAPVAETTKKVTKAVRKEKVDASKANWDEYKAKYGHLKPVSYSMSGQFTEGSPIQHKVLGWGYIMSIQNDRLEVLFKEGLKILISNYRA